jgi:tRNA dimethylallyltransferase
MAPTTDRLLLIVGPTAVGKTEVALALADAVGGEIVSLDSRQMVRGLDIGTAKPTAQQRARARHHLIDVAAPDEPLSLAEVLALAYAAIQDILARSRRPILVGGTGQYVRAILEGWEPPPVPPDPARRAALERLAAVEGPAALHQRLARLDPLAAGRIHPRNVRRIVRALEVTEALGRPFSASYRRSGARYPMHTIGLTRARAELFERADRRLEAMLQLGLEEEVRALVAAGYGFDLPAMSSLGYGEWREHFEGRIDRDEVVRRIRSHTRRLIRRQAAWFRAADPRVEWVDVSVQAERVIREVVAAWEDVGP